MKIVLNFSCFGPYYWYENPIYSFLGFLLIISVITLSIREKIRKRKTEKKELTKKQGHQTVQEVFITTDVLGFEKPSINYREQNYKTVDKSKLKYVMYILLLIIGLLMIVLSSPIKKGPFKGSSGGGVIHHPEIDAPSYYDYYFKDVRKYEKLDSNLNFKENDFFKNSND